MGNAFLNTVAALAIGGAVGYYGAAWKNGASIENASAENVPAPVAAAPAAVSAVPQDKEFIEKIIAEYLQKNPGAVYQALIAYQEEQEKAKHRSAAEKVKQYQSDLTDLSVTPSAGAKDADVTVIEFFDYSCGYCRRSFAEIDKLLKEDPKVRVLFKEFPILGESSQLAAKAALAVFVTQPDKYYEVHGLLMTKRLREEAAIMQELQGIGLDTAKIKEAMQGKQVAELLEKTNTLARAIGVNGTPAFVVNDKFVGGAIDLEQMKSMIAAARAGK
jgi:protein-disulfide isomerase